MLEDIGVLIGFVCAMVVFLGCEFIWTKFIEPAKVEKIKKEIKDNRDDKELELLVKLYEENAEMLKTYLACGVNDELTIGGCKSAMNAINHHIKLKYTLAEQTKIYRSVANPQD